MPNWLFATDSQTTEDLNNELLTSTTRKLGNNLLHEYQASSRRQKGIKEELSRRIRLMQKIPDSHPREIFVYNDKGFKSFTTEVEAILTRDLLRKPQKGAVPKYLDYTRGMLKDEIENGKEAQPVTKEVTKGQDEGNGQLKEEYEQLVEEFGAMETEHEQLIEKYRQLKKDHAQLQKEHERVLHVLNESKEKETKAPEQKTASVPIRRPCDEGIKQPPVLGSKIIPPEIHNQTREPLVTKEAREPTNAQARERGVHEQEEAKIRKWEDENTVKEMNKCGQELREERAARENQRSRAPSQDQPGKERLDVDAGDAAPQMPRHTMHGGLVDSQAPPQTRSQKELLLGQKTGYPNMQQGVPHHAKPAPLQPPKDLKSVSFDLPNRTPIMGQTPPIPQRPVQREIVEQQSDNSRSVPFGLPTKTANTDQGPPAEQNHKLLQQTDYPRSLSAGHPTETPTMGQIFPAQQPPVQQFPVQQRSERLQQANDSRSFPYGLPTGIPDMGHLFPAHQKSAPLRQTDESKNASCCLPTQTASTSTIPSLPTRPTRNGPLVEIPVRSQEPSRIANFDQGRVVRRMDQPPFIRRPDAP